MEATPIAGHQINDVTTGQWQIGWSLASESESSECTFPPTQLAWTDSGAGDSQCVDTLTAENYHDNVDNVC